MTTSRLLSSLVAALALTGCGGDEPHKAAAPPPAARKPATPPTAAAGPPVGCLAKWTSGTTGTLVCTGTGVPFDKAAFRLDRVCVNDPRISAYTAGGKTVTLTLESADPYYCANLGGVAEVPETCSCVAPAGGDCNPPADGFACAAFGHSAPAGG
jgi:hypothetical protein